MIAVQFQQFALLRVAGLFDDGQFQRRVMVLRVVLLQDVLHVFGDLVDLEQEEQSLGLEIAHLQDEQHPTCQLRDRQFSLAAVRKILGHERLATTAIYLNLTDIMWSMNTRRSGSRRSVSSRLEILN